MGTVLSFVHVGSYGIPMRGGFGSRDTGTVDALGGLPGAEADGLFSPKESQRVRPVSWLVIIIVMIINGELMVIINNGL